MSSYHIPVLGREVIDALCVKPGEKYIDATLGGLGHTRLILERGGVVLGIDTDKEAIKYAKEQLRVESLEFKINKNIFIAWENFLDIQEIATKCGFENVAGILFDLGVSSHQIDTAERGFSFLKNGPLDMRMNTSLTIQAKDLVSGLSKHELADLFFTLGGERQARKIALYIVEVRKTRQITTTNDLVNVIQEAIGRYSYDVKTRAVLAMRVFQALRIAVNDELRSIEEAIPKALTLLKNNGRLAVISFHSLEDRIVKQQFLKLVEEKKGNIITKKPIVASYEEENRNTRSRSAKLRVFERTI